jgi:hypothetical protein
MTTADNRYIAKATAREIPVYLAGPILGCTEGEANDWRLKVDKFLRPFNIVGISPLRCEPIHGERYTMEYADPKFGTARAISSKNLFDVHECKLGIFYIPKPVATDEEVRERLDRFEENAPDSAGCNYVCKSRDYFAAGMNAAKLHSFGTVIELAWTHALHKPTILVSDDPFIMGHPVIDACAKWKVPTLEDACDVAIGLLAGYAGGKNV